MHKINLTLAIVGLLVQIIDLIILAIDTRFIMLAFVSFALTTPQIIYNIFFHF